MDYITLRLGAVNCFWRQLWDIFKEKRAKGKKKIKTEAWMLFWALVLSFDIKFKSLPVLYF